MSWLHRKAEVIRNMAVKRGEIPNWLGDDLVSYHSGQHRDGVYYSLTNIGVNCSFEDDLTGWINSAGTPTMSTLQSKNGAKSLNCDSTGTSSQVKQTFTAIDNHVYFVSCWVYCSARTAGSLGITVGLGTANATATKSTTTPGWERVSTVLKAEGTSSVVYVGAFTSANLSGFVDAISIIDLTAIFGTGNEPTATEMDAILAADGTAYWDGTRNILCNPNGKYYWYDYSGNGRHMKMSNLAYTGTSNLDGYGFNCDGVDDYGSIADSFDTRLTQGGTLTAWIKPRTIGELSGGRIFDKSTDINVTNGYAFRVGADNTLYFFPSSPAISSVNAITLNKWQLASVAFSALGRHIYINAVDVTASGGTETTLPPDAAGVVAIGNRANATDRTFDGQIDKPRIIKRVLSQAEIYQIFQNERRFYGV